MEMPKYQWPRPRDILLGLWQRAAIFLKRAGTIIFISTIVLWALLSFPKPPEGSNVSPVDYSIAGRIAGGLNTVLEPIGFNRDISLALVPAMAAREVAVSEIGRASCRERVCRSVWFTVVAVSLKKKKITTTMILKR